MRQHNFQQDQKYGRHCHDNGYINGATVFKSNDKEVDTAEKTDASPYRGFDQALPVQALAFDKKGGQPEKRAAAKKTGCRHSLGGHPVRDQCLGEGIIHTPENG